jgi:hypothetical protein
VVSDVGALLRTGSRQKWDDGRTSQLSLQPVGRLAVSTGLVTFKDPFAHTPAGVATVEVPTGRVPVEVATLHFSASRDGLPEMDLATAVVLRVGTGEAVEWQRANTARFAVDAGTGLVCDMTNDDSDALSRSESIMDEVLAQQFMAEPTPGEILRLFFNCGMGDGDYDVWQGFSAEGSTTCVIADLELLSHGDPLD